MESSRVSTMHLLVPEPPSMTLSRRPSTAFRRSLPAPPTWLSTPAPPTSVSPSGPPITLSLPLPPSTLLLPLPPLSRSLPPLPLIRSLPPLPLILSAFFVPTISSLRLVPVIFFATAGPAASATARPRTAIAAMTGGRLLRHGCRSPSLNVPPIDPSTFRRGPCRRLKLAKRFLRRNREPKRHPRPTWRSHA